MFQRRFVLDSYQNLALLQNLYRLKAAGFKYIDPFNVNQNTTTQKPKSMEEFSSNLMSCHLCDLSKSRSQAMPGYGDTHADLMIIDFSVSPNDDELNQYYSGRSGKILQNMIENVLELKLSQVYFTHAIKCKPLNANTPSISEWESCKSYLFWQIEYVKPKVIVTLGKEVYAKMVSEDEDFENVRGHIIDFENYKLVPLQHPSFILRNPQSKKTTFKDLKTIKSCL